MRASSEYARLSHKCKADPLNSQLCNTKKTGYAMKCLELFAACDIPTRLWEEEDVAECGCGGCGAKQDEVGRDAFGCSSFDDSNMLWEVTDEHSYYDRAAIMLASDSGWESVI